MNGFHNRARLTSAVRYLFHGKDRGSILLKWPGALRLNADRVGSLQVVVRRFDYESHDLFNRCIHFTVSLR